MNSASINKEKILEFLKNKEYQKLRMLLTEYEAVDIALLMEELSPHELVPTFRLLPKELAAEVFVELGSDGKQLIIESFTDREVSEMLGELFIDDTVDLIEEMPANIVQRILVNASPDERGTINELLGYADGSAGSLMTTEYVSLRQDMTTEQAIEHIREVAPDKETIYTCYVTCQRLLVGVVSIKDILTAGRNTLIKDIMETRVIAVQTSDKSEKIGGLFDRYDYLALPVVDAEGRIVGIITVDDAIDAMRQDAEDDFAKMAAITPDDKPYLSSSVLKICFRRLPWLLLLMVSATFTGMIISYFEAALAAQVALTGFIPMLMDTGGNSGSQTSVTIIRGLSLGEIKFRDIFKVIWKEIRISVICGGILAVATFGKIMLVDRAIMGTEITAAIAAVVSATLFATVVIAKLIGCTLPMIVDRLGLDPAVTASPFITTLVDAISLLVYFGFAGSILGNV